ncbi:MAG: hypothetical protein AAGE89_07810 [Pseudomonadota bacterium]
MSDSAAGHNHFSLLALISARLAKPLSFVHDDFLTLDTFDALKVRSLASHPAFENAINRAVCRKMALERDVATTEFLHALKIDSSLTRAARLALAPRPVLDDCARHVAAAKLHPQILKCIFRADKQRVRELLGEDAYMTATREAPAFHPNIPAIGHEVSLDLMLKPYTQPQTDAGENQDEAVIKPHSDSDNPAVILGLNLMLLYVRSAHHALGRLLELALPRAASENVVKPAPLSQEQRTSLGRLIDRKGALA